MWAAHATVINSILYISGGWCPKDTRCVCNVYKFEFDKNVWNVLPPLQQYNGIPVNINNHLTIISGRNSTAPYKVTKAVATYSHNIWTSTYPNLLVARLYPAVVPYHQYIIVAGGLAEDSSVLASIEVFDSTKLLWMIVKTCLPKPMYRISATICDDSFTIVGYGNVDHNHSNKVYAIPINKVISKQKVQQPLMSPQWCQLPSAPFRKTTLVPNISPPMIVGGSDDQYNAVYDVAMYDDTNKCWRKVSSLPINCAWATVAVINQVIIVMGGCSDTGTDETRNATAHSDVNVGKLVLCD